MNTNLFEYATRNKIRFQTSRGEMSVEQLWDIPLRANGGFNLNEVAKTANKALKASSEENFVENARTAEQARCEAVLDIVKHVIDVKISDEKAAEARAKNRAEKEKLLAALDDAQNDKLKNLSIPEIKRRIAALGD